MAFDAIHFRGRQLALPQHRLDALLLRRAVGRRERRAPPILGRESRGLMAFAEAEAWLDWLPARQQMEPVEGSNCFSLKHSAPQSSPRA